MNQESQATEPITGPHTVTMLKKIASDYGTRTLVQTPDMSCYRLKVIYLHKCWSCGVVPERALLSGAQEVGRRLWQGI